MKRTIALLFLPAFLFTASHAGADPSLLSIGNSFTYGYYLHALVVFGNVTGLDPRALGENECSGYELGMSRNEVRMLQQAAFEQLASEGRVVQRLWKWTDRGRRCAVPARHEQAQIWSK